MSENVTLKQASAVLLAQDINQSIFRPTWLLANHVFTEEELAGEVVFVPGMTQIKTGGFEFLVLPDRIQWRRVDVNAHDFSHARRVIGTIVNCLPHTPFSGIGINYEFQVTPSSGDYSEWNRQLCASTWMSSTLPEARDEARFGCQCKVQTPGGHLVMSLNAMRRDRRKTTDSEDLPAEVLLAKINRHFDVLIGNPSPITHALEAAEELYQTSHAWCVSMSNWRGPNAT